MVQVTNTPKAYEIHLRIPSLDGVEKFDGIPRLKFLVF